MLLLTKGSASDRIVVTLNEKTTLTNPNYLFVFENVVTKEKVRKVFLSSDDLSGFKERYNEFIINTASLFSVTGDYYYKVYEQAGTSTDETGLTMVEQGKAKLITQTEAAIGYTSQPAIKGYEG